MPRRVGALAPVLIRIVRSMRERVGDWIFAQREVVQCVLLWWMREKRMWEAVRFSYEERGDCNGVDLKIGAALPGVLRQVIFWYITFSVQYASTGKRDLRNRCIKYQS